MFSFQDQRALITGASGGIGGAIAKALHQKGAHVIISGTQEEKLRTLEKELGNRVTVLTCSLFHLNQVDALFDKSEEQSAGPVDVLINNAGITRDNLTIRMKNDEWDDVMAINLTSTFRLCRSAIKAMMKRRYGRIINVSSIVGVTGNPGQANYCATKSGMIGMSKSMAQEVATRGITVNCIAPGFIETPMTNKLNETQKENILSQIPTKIMGKPEDIAAATLYLASREAAYVTGQTLHVNGGMAMI